MNESSLNPARLHTLNGDPGETHLYGRILVAHDLTAGSSTIFAQALAIARKSEAKLFLAHVDDPLRVNALAYIPPACYEHWVQGCQEYVRQQLRPLVEQARAVGVEAEILALVGPYGGELLDAACAQHIDLIITGLHRHHWLTRLLTGSTTLDILKSPACPILILPLFSFSAPMDGRPPSKPALQP